MLLTLTTTHQPATDLGYLLHKHPERHQRFDLPFGAGHVFYPEASEQRCTAALLLEVDPVGLVRGRRRDVPYINDRPYVASSFLSVALVRLFRSAMKGRCAERPELVETAIPLVATLAALPARGGEALLRRLFEPLGYQVTAAAEPLDPHFPDWGASRIHRLTLEGTLRLRELLTHLYVLVPVLDDEKHYWVGDEEVEKLLQRGEGWLAAHPERELIVRRYLKRRRSLVRQAIQRLTVEEEPEEEREGEGEVAVERPLRLHAQRHEAVVETLLAAGARRVLDLGCSTGRLLQRLAQEPSLEEVVGMDVSTRALEIARARLHLERRPAARRPAIRLLHGSLIYRDARLSGFDAAAVVEVIEHLDPVRLEAFEQVLFEHARPALVLLTTPNREYNVLFDGLTDGALRHRDHRFEWRRDEFEGWAGAVAARYGYEVSFRAVGPVDERLGAPSQMAIFRCGEGSA